jgi:hypothetical protein
MAKLLEIIRLIYPAEELHPKAQNQGEGTRDKAARDKGIPIETSLRASRFSG